MSSLRASASPGRVRRDSGSRIPRQPLADLLRLCIISNSPFPKNLPRIFNKEFKTHEWAVGITELEVASELDRCYALNLRWDPNVSSDRHNEALRTVKEDASGEAAEAMAVFGEGARVRAGLFAHYKAKVRDNARPEFADPTVNRENFVLTGSKPHAVHPGLELVRVLDLNGLTDIYAWAIQPENRDRYAGAFDPRTEIGVHDFDALLNANLDLSRSSSSNRRLFLKRLFDACNDYLNGVGSRPPRQRPFQPVWATFPAYLNPIDKPEKWLATLGVPKKSGRWFVLLRYDQSSITLVRPSSLDSSPQPYFFPGAPWLPGAGACMDFDRHGSQLTPEVIHVQRELSIEQWENAGAVCSKTSDNVGPLLRESRLAHLSKLRVFEGADPDWMNPPY